jgi:hypothetical protein
MLFSTAIILAIIKEKILCSVLFIKEKIQARPGRPNLNTSFLYEFF